MKVITLIMRNTTAERIRIDLASLYNETERKLQDLEILDRNQEKYGNFVTHIVESCLPEEVLLSCRKKPKS